MKTQVGIVGAGPAGLMLSHLLSLQGIESVVLESHDRAHIESRVRAGVLEQGTVDLLRESGLGDRLDREGLVHHGVELRFAARGHRVDFADLTNGKGITIYAQHEVIKDMVAARLKRSEPILFEAHATALTRLESLPVIVYEDSAGRHELRCDFVAGCDGFHGICRPAIPEGALAHYDHTYPFGWLGILARVPPASRELIYSYHERGFALLSMRSPEISRLYVQCPAEDEIADWSDDRIWNELKARMATHDGFVLRDGPILQRGITAMRAYVAEPMRYGKLFLVGDAAHIVPPTGAKGLNLAIADVRILARALAAFYERGRTDLLDAYSETCLRRVWRVQRFSSWMTSMLHRWPGEDGFAHRLRLAELDYVSGSRAASTTLAENYVGLPFE